MRRTHSTPEKAYAAIRKAGFEFFLYSRTHRRGNEVATVIQLRDGRYWIRIETYA